MCPLRLILVFLSATLAGYVAWRSIGSAPTISDSVPENEDNADAVGAKNGRRVGLRKAIGDGLWVFWDMASGRYLWKAVQRR
ncbi:hypothetical protein IHE45_05G201400 [Dioscorea alata]|uniref:Uncharacterized protein n=1 Tax=Dioscorea alata TaxID=55571 RepID=A0ACB7W7V6_DIOAL|nr:hypothetical protein IHE45_05G201400 [Dioscorea alata]